MVILFLMSAMISSAAIGEEMTNILGQKVTIVAQADVPAPAAVEPMPETAPSIAEKVPPPPEWLDNVMSVVFKIPVVGPYLLKIMQFLGLIASVLTVIVTLSLGGLQSLAVILKWVKLSDLAVKILAFQNSPVFYWLKFFSIYNAQKKDEPQKK